MVYPSPWVRRPRGPERPVEKGNDNGSLRVDGIRALEFLRGDVTKELSGSYFKTVRPTECRRRGGIMARLPFRTGVILRSPPVFRRPLSVAPVNSADGPLPEDGRRRS